MVKAHLHVVEERRAGVWLGGGEVRVEDGGSGRGISGCWRWDVCYACMRLHRVMLTRLDGSAAYEAQRLAKIT